MIIASHHSSIRHFQPTLAFDQPPLTITICNIRSYIPFKFFYIIRYMSITSSLVKFLKLMTIFSCITLVITNGPMNVTVCDGTNAESCGFTGVSYLLTTIPNWSWRTIKGNNDGYVISNETVIINENVVYKCHFIHTYHIALLILVAVIQRQ